jgi:protease IV
MEFFEQEMNSSIHLVDSLHICTANEKNPIKVEEMDWIWENVRSFIYVVNPTPRSTIIMSDPESDPINQTTPPPLAGQQPAQPGPGYYRGGAPVGNYSPPPRRSRFGIFTCLIVIFIFFGLCIAALVFFGGLASRFVEAPTIMSHGEKIGLLRIDDVIMDVDKTLEIIKYYSDTDSIRGVLVRIDSPGGAVGSSQEVYQALRNLSEKKHKPVIASLGNTAASGGYYIASGTDYIISNPGTITGSIGVIMGLPNVEDITQKIGFKYQVVKSGKFKDIGSMTRGLSDDEKALLQGVIDDAYSQFLGAILAKRRPQLEDAAKKLQAENTTITAVESINPTAEGFLKSIADGRIVTGQQALKFGLVDQIGTQTDALDKLGEKLSISKPEIYEYKPRRTFKDIFEASAESAVQGVTGPMHFRVEYRLPY